MLEAHVHAIFSILYQCAVFTLQHHLNRNDDREEEKKERVRLWQLKGAVPS